MLRNNGRHNFRSPFGIQPSLVLDFAGTGTLDSRVTFSRSTTGTYYNSSGVLTTAAINAPRFDYNPTTLQSLGLLVEESRTNVLLNSLLDGTNLSTQIVTTTAIPYTLSFYGTGTIVLTGTNISTQVGTGAYPSRKVFTFTPTAGALTLTVTGTVQYAQLEAGSFATSFIPTTSSQVTRTSDNASMTGTNFSSWFNNAQGSLYGEVIDSGLNPWAVAASINDKFYFRQTASNSYSGVLGSGGVYFTTTLPVKFAGTYSGNTIVMSANGLTAQSQTGTAISGATTLNIGNYNDSAFYQNGRIKKLAYYPIALTATQLQALTES